MDEVKLVMNFENTAGIKTTVTLTDVRPDISKAEVDALANQIINKSILSYKNSDIVKYNGSQIYTTHIESL